MSDRSTKNGEMTRQEDSLKRGKMTRQDDSLKKTKVVARRLHLTDAALKIDAKNYFLNASGAMGKNIMVFLNLLKNSGKYEIIADLSELSYINEIEIVSMKRVIATFVDEKNRKMIIFSDKALFNNTSYDTKFENNTKIQ